MAHRALVSTALALLLAAAAAADELPRRRHVPAPDSHFLAPDGTIQRGVRCATPAPTRAEIAAVERTLGRYRAIFGAARPGRGIDIPVAFHVIYRTERDGTQTGNVPEEQLDAQIDVMNDAFAPAGFSFTKAVVNRVANNAWFGSCYGAERTIKRSLAVDPAHTLNFYLCAPKGGILGFAYLPQSFPEDSFMHGVVVLYSTLPGGSAAPYNEGDTGTHEVGHYLGLLHTFENGCKEPGDLVADTPAEGSAAFGCPTGRDTCPSAGFDPITNFMDYTDDPCMFEFSGGQDSRMQDIVAIYKPSL
ncbi:MAG TPA: zinc metalloprotease [Thermoanaerobaculia bacterium]|nr:zinc metalloprotease [Thermoanaerobaculia bacterium]